MNLPKEKMVGGVKNYNVLAGVHCPVKMWNKHVKIEEKAQEQLLQITQMPFVKPYVAAMPDTHWGMGATVGSVIPTQGAVMPAAVGVDIGCGMMAVRTNMTMDDITTVDSKNIEYWGHDWRKWAFEAISKAVPHGRTDNGGARDIGAWPENNIPADIRAAWSRFETAALSNLFARHPQAFSRNAERHLGTLGTGNHFIEVCTEIDNPDSKLWVVIHSGSRGFGNRIGTYFTKLAGELCAKWFVNLPNKDLGYFPEGTEEYYDYLTAVIAAQKFAWVNREIMMDRVLRALGAKVDGNPAGLSPISNTFKDENGVIQTAGNIPAIIHMHHNYAQAITINGQATILTRKGAVDATEGKFVIIPGSMGAKTYLAKGLGNKESFWSCSHGAGRAMSRGEALKTFSVEDHAKATEGVYCDKTIGVVDETPGAYKDIDAVMESQRDLVEPVVKIKQLVCVKGLSD